MAEEQNQSQAQPQFQKQQIEPSDVFDFLEEFLSSAQCEAVIRNLVQKCSEPPKGFRGVVSSTWSSGWQGKTCMVAGGLGGLLTVGALVEAIGAVTGWESVRIIKKLAEWYSA